jgi:hypothetical protein
MHRADDNLTGVRPITSIFNNVIIRESKTKDRPINDIIQEVGAHLTGSDPSCGYTVINENERVWYKKHKGYSNA